MDLLTVGEAFDDLILAGLPRLPRLGEELRVPTLARSPGGGAVITAVAAARLGLQVSTLSAVSEEGAAVLRLDGVTLINVRRAAERSAVSVALSTRDDRAFVTFDGVNRVLEPRLLARFRSLRRRPRHVHFALTPLDCSRWVRVVNDLRSRGKTTSWDFGWSERLLADPGFTALVAAVDWLFVNEVEAKLYARAASLGVARRIWPQLARAIVLKLGRRGSMVLTADGVVTAPAVRAKAIDTTGAGDAFNGGFLTAILRGRGVSRALRLGNIVGARSTEAAGGIAGLPNPRDLPAWARAVVEAA